MQLRRPRLPRVWHPVLIALIPILSAFEANVQQVGRRELIGPVLLTLTLTFGLWVVLVRAMRSVARAALAVSAFVFFFFNFGALDGYLGRATDGASGEVSLARSVSVLVAGVAVLAILLRAVYRRRRLLWPLTRLLNGFSALVVAALVGLLAFETILSGGDEPASVSRPLAQTRPGEGDGVATGQVLTTVPNPPRLPDIYYIVLDSYGRGDVLRDLYDYDNSAFLDGLRRRGFFVADRSTANYCQTFLSLSSSLNCRYHTDLAGSSVHWTVLVAAIRDNSILKTLKSHGYHLVTYNTGFIPTNMPDADLYLSPFPATRALLRPEDDFRALLLEKTPLNLYWRARARLEPAEEPTADRYTLNRQMIRYTLDSLGTAAPERSPKFVFAHVLCPHPPFLFGENGQDTSPRERPYFCSDGSYYKEYYGATTVDYVRGYRGQCKFVTGQAERAIDAILRNSPAPPIIIVQSDHGPGSRWQCNSGKPTDSNLRERMSILNAYYLPDGGDKALYADITPVNSFRVVLNHYFGARLKLLPDESYFSSVKEPFRFVNVSSKVRGKPNQACRAR